MLVKLTDLFHDLRLDFAVLDVHLGGVTNTQVRKNGDGFVGNDKHFEMNGS